MSRTLPSMASQDEGAACAVRGWSSCGREPTARSRTAAAGRRRERTVAGSVHEFTQDFNSESAASLPASVITTQDFDGDLESAEEVIRGLVPRARIELATP